MIEQLLEIVLGQPKVIAYIQYPISAASKWFYYRARWSWMHTPPPQSHCTAHWNSLLCIDWWDWICQHLFRTSITLISKYDDLEVNAVLHWWAYYNRVNLSKNIVHAINHSLILCRHEFYLERRTFLYFFDGFDYFCYNLVHFEVSRR